MSGTTNSNAVAIIGIGCRFPGGANSPEGFWRLLADGVDAITEFPLDRFDVPRLYDRNPAASGKFYVNRGGFIGKVDEFDASFFGISPREAVFIDPQHRLLLEVVYEALDDAGLPLDRLAGSRTGVFVGISSHDYADIQFYPGNFPQIGTHTNSGGATSIAANRISYQYDLRGPSTTVDTACSSSLTALHFACRSLKNGDCDLALVGGVSLLLTPAATIGFCKASMLSPDGRCRAFDAAANGYVRSEGVGVVVLKPLALALADRDLIYAVIKGTAINQDGHTTGLTVPSRDAQAANLRRALADAGLSASDVDYVEAHGTGTLVGDPIEASAIGDVFGRVQSNQSTCLVGSVKSNIGHLEAAAGMPGLIKTALAISHRQIPPSLHFINPNPTIDFARLGLRVVTSAQAWPARNGVATAGVNSFGFGGANAHVLLQEALPPQPADVLPACVETTELLPISARSEQALKAVARAYVDFFHGHPGHALADICGSAALHGTHHQHRATIVASSREEMIKGLESVARGEPRANIAIGRATTGDPHKLAFVFGGMGPQWWGMGHQLMRDQPVFQDVIQHCDALLRPLVGWSLIEMLVADEAISRVTEADIAQVMNFALQVGLASLWKSWGIVPDAIIGHSAGEIAAAHVAGVHDLANATLLACHRGRLQNRTSGQGAMLAVGLSAAEAERVISKYDTSVSLAAVNSPTACTLSGDTAALEAIMQGLHESSVFARMLQVTVPYHSAAMEQIRDELFVSLRPLEAQSASIPLISDVTGDWAAGSEYDASYWWRNVRQPVRFSQGIATLIGDGFDTFVEISPHTVLVASLNECLAAAGTKGTVLPTLRRLEDDREVMLRSLGRLFVQGRAVNWESVQSHFQHRVKLPRYPWQRERYWFESRAAADDNGPQRDADEAAHPLLGSRLRAAGSIWEAKLSEAVRRWVDDHVVQGSVMFPGAAVVEIALAAAQTRAPDAITVIRDIELMKALFCDETTVLQTALTSEGNLTLHSAPASDDEGWVLHARCRIATAGVAASRGRSVDEIRSSCNRESSHAVFYDTMKQHGFRFGKSFRGIDKLWFGEGEALAYIDITKLNLEIGRYNLHPAVLDVGFHLLGGLVFADATLELRHQLFLPVLIESVIFFGSPPASDAWVHARLIRSDRGNFVADFDLMNDEGTPYVEVRGLHGRLLDQESAAPDRLADWLYQFGWEPANRADERRPGGQSRVPAHAAQHVASIQVSSPAGSPETDLKSYYDVAEPRLLALATQLVASAFRALGWDPSVGDVVATQELLNEMGVVAPAIPLAMRLLTLLGEQGLLSPVTDGWFVASPLPSSVLETLGQAVLAADSAYQPAVELMLRTGGMLAGILRGEADAREVLFGWDGMRTLRRFYRGVPALAFYNKLLSDIVVMVIAQSTSERPIRILEVGGGTGGFTAPLLEALPEGRFEYLFTDISPLFTGQATQEFGSAPGFTTRILDIEKGPDVQGLARNTCDIIVAANVLHATADLARTLTHLRQMLAPRGLLMLIELTPRPRWIEVIFGVTEGWWKFTDRERRTSHPLLEPDQWLKLLKEEGFDEVTLFDDGYHMGIPAHTVLLAQAGEKSESAALASGTANWLVLADHDDTAERLADLLMQGGDSVVIIAPAESFRQCSSNRYEARPGQNSDIAAVLAAMGESAERLRGVVVVGAPGTPSDDTLPSELLIETQEAACESALAMLSSLQAHSFAKDPTLWLITAGAQAAGGQEPSSFAQAPLWGLGRVMMREQSKIQCRLVDIDTTRSDAALVALAHELRAHESEEEELAFRGSNRWVRRLTRMSPDWAEKFVVTREPRADEGWHLTIGVPGAFGTIAASATARREPGPREVEIRVAAAALNFRDVLMAAGMYPTALGDEPDAIGNFGVDCAGWVVRCGEAVRDVVPGDEVVALAPNAFGAFAVTHEALVAHKPAQLSFEAGAASIVFITAHYALKHLARLSPGERILIHAATGGVGLAAIQIAQNAGAEIFATAGNPEKRAYLEALGVPHIMDSRSLAFADEVREITKGEGVDVVLNSLVGEAIVKGIEILRPYGRFIEIGKRDIYADQKLGLLPFRNNLSFFAVDMLGSAHERPELAGSVLREVMDCFENGVYRTLPQRVFPVSKAEDAVRLMAQAKHMGKVVLGMADEKLQIGMPRTLCRGNGTYLVTGGLGGFGLATAQWLVENGARSLVLMGRSKPDRAARSAIDELAAIGAKVEIAQGDVASESVVKSIIERIRTTESPLRGVLHCAMVLDDGPLADITRDNFATVLAPKTAGAWNLHRQTLGDELDFFVLYSSFSSIVGNPMQGAYSAANAFLDVLAQYRRLRGLPALAVHWGAISDSGTLVRRPEIAKLVTAQGFATLASNEALAALQKLLMDGQTDGVVARMDWRRLADYLPTAMTSPSFRSFALDERVAAATSGRKGDSFRLVLEKVADVTERANLVEQFLCERVGDILGMDPGRLDVEKPLTDMGLDSLIAVELVTLLDIELGLQFPIVSLLQGIAIRPLAARVAVSLMPGSSASAPTPEPEISQPRTVEPTIATYPQVLAETNGGIKFSAVQSKRTDEEAAPSPSAHAASATRGTRRDYTALDYRRWTPGQQVARWCTRGVIALSTRVRVTGQVGIPPSAAFVLAINHLSLADALLLFSIMQRPIVGLVAEWVQERMATRWFMGELGNAIFVCRGEGDFDALENAEVVLRSGGIVGIAPEGTRSRTKSLQPALTGVAYLAIRTGVPVLPVGMWGQEELARSWRRLRRPEVNINIGEPVHLPASDTSASNLQQGTDQIMQALAALLPAQYRGVYR